MSAAEWAGIGAFCLMLGQLARRSRHHHRRHRMRMVSWRWDQIAEYNRRQTRFDKFLLRMAKPVGHLALPLTLAGLGALIAAGFVLLS